MDDTPVHHPAPASAPGVPRAAMAANWRTIIALDLLLGLATVAVGVVLAIGSNRGAGVALAVLGSLYTTMVVMRARRWARLRRQARLGD